MLGAKGKQTTKWYKESLMDDANVLYADCGGGFSQVLSFIKIHQIVQFKNMQYIPQLSPLLKRQKHSIMLTKNGTT